RAGCPRYRRILRHALERLTCGSRMAGCQGDGVVERTLSWLNRFRRLKIRYEHPADMHLAFFAAWLRPHLPVFPRLTTSTSRERSAWTAAHGPLLYKGHDDQEIGPRQRCRR